jgi:hypothetical protein
MKRQIRPLTVVTLAVAGLLTAMPAAVYAQQAPETPTAGDHSAHQPASQPASGTSIEELINRMHDSTGNAKVAVMADLIEILIKERKSCAAMMEDKKMMPMAMPAPTTARPPAPNAPSH